jgi:hypothetical protein
MKIILISAGLLATTILQASPAFARASNLHLLHPPLTAQHINGLPARNALIRDHRVQRPASVFRAERWEGIETTGRR